MLPKAVPSRLKAEDRKEEFMEKSKEMMKMMRETGMGKMLEEIAIISMLEKNDINEYKDIFKSVETDEEILKEYIEENGEETGRYLGVVGEAHTKIETIYHTLSKKGLEGKPEFIKVICEELHSIADKLERLI